MIRVDGRLANSNLNYDKKYPIVFPESHKLSKLIFQYYHFGDFHVGHQAVLHTWRLKCWPLSGRNIARKVARMLQYLTYDANKVKSDFSSERVMPSSSFSNVG